MRYAHDSLVARLLAGENEAVGIVSRWISIVVSSFRFRELRHDRLDIHQDALLLVLKCLREGQFDPARDFRLYVQAIARHAALRALRRSRLQAAREALDKAEPRLRENAPDLVTIEQVLLRSSAPCRQLLVQYFLEGRDYEELARELNVPVGTVKSRLFRCLATAAHRTGRRKSSIKPIGDMAMKD